MKPEARLIQPFLSAALALFLLDGCVTGSEVQSTTDEMFKRIEEFKEAGYICAPVEYAHCKASAEFARTESDHGDTLKAKAHLDQAREWFQKLWAATHNPDNSLRDGCEGDDDDDSVLNSKDRCRDEAEDYDGDQDTDGCPEWDKDSDGIPDDRDNCPTDPEDKDGFEDTDGCPDADNDLDGIPDVNDKCRNQPEDFDKFQDEDGCPDPDNDNDGIPDLKDRCINEPEDFDGDQDEDGCPDLYKSIVVKEDKIELKDKIYFAFNKATIMAQSFDMLKEIAQVIKAKPTIKVRIEGHTDDKGNDKYNKKLSESRAKAVREFLIKEGVAPDRMIAIGYGEEKPLVPNDSEEGREQNRRVEFFIIEQ